MTGPDSSYSEEQLKEELKLMRGEKGYYLNLLGNISRLSPEILKNACWTEGQRLANLYEDNSDKLGVTDLEGVITLFLKNIGAKEVIINKLKDEQVSICGVDQELDVYRIKATYPSGECIGGRFKEKLDEDTSSSMSTSMCRDTFAAFLSGIVGYIENKVANDNKVDGDKKEASKKTNPLYAVLGTEKITKSENCILKPENDHYCCIFTLKIPKYSTLMTPK